MTLPTGTITFLFTDIEGSTRQWDAHPQAMGAALRRHDSLMREAIETNGGIVFKTVGDAFCAAFPTAVNALSATLAAQRALVSETWQEPVQIRVRMALHTGAAEERGGDYFGPPLNRVARLLSLGHGSQTILSQTTHDLICDTLPHGTSALDLGLHRLKDLQRPEHVFQLNHPSLPSKFPPLKSLDQFPNNLPRQLTSFIGREKEMAQVKALLEKASLLTLTGSGGCGKTRLALQAAAEMLDDFTDGVWLVELASLSDPALVPQTVADVLGVREAPGVPITKTLLSSIKDTQMLLVLDNCEHVLQTSARLVDTLLKSCPKVRVLVSSREALGIAGESAYRVPSLSVPNPKQPQTPESLTHFEAVRLFNDRAASAKNDFTVTPQNASALASVCHHLDGIPLAIELAAARVRSLSVEEINTRLDNRFRLLTGGNRAALPRHQTLRALIDWSYDLLNDSEKAVLGRLSVFAGGWTLAATEQVCAIGGIEEWEVLDLLTSLVDKSLVVAEAQQEHTRYRLLETVRQYAWDRLAQSGESKVVRERHQGYFLQLAQQAEPQLRGADQLQWLALLEAEHDNLRAALVWALDAAPTSALELSGALFWFWWLRGDWTEGSEWLANARLRQPTIYSADVYARVVVDAAILAYYQHDQPAMDVLVKEGMATARQSTDKWVLCMALIASTLLAFDTLNEAGIQVLLTEFLDLARELGDPWLLATALVFSGIADGLSDTADLESAFSRLREGLAVAERTGDRWVTGVAVGNLAEKEYVGKLYQQSEIHCIRALHLFLELGQKAFIAPALELLGALAGVKGQAERGARLFGAAETIREASNYPVETVDRLVYDSKVAPIRALLDAEAFASAWKEGNELSLDRAVRYALEEPTNA